MAAGAGAVLLEEQRAGQAQLRDGKIRADDAVGARRRGAAALDAAHERGPLGDVADLLPALLRRQRRLDDLEALAAAAAPVRPPQLAVAAEAQLLRRRELRRVEEALGERRGQGRALLDGRRVEPGGRSGRRGEGEAFRVCDERQQEKLGPRDHVVG